MEQTLLNQAAAIAAVSQYTAEKGGSCFRYPKKVEVLPNGIDVDIPIANLIRNPKQVIFAGSLVQKKGIYRLAQAWNLVAKQIPDARLVVLGKGSIKNVVAFLDVNTRHTVSFMGHVATDKLYEYLAGSAMAVFPSYAEAFALAPLEAMACSTAVINSNRTSGPELIEDHVDGLLIDPDNIEQIASAIIALLNNPDERDRLSKNGSKKVKQDFDINRIAVKNFEFYNTVLNPLKRG